MRLLFGLGGGDYRDSHAEDILELFVGGLREYGVLFDAKRVVTHRIDGGSGDALEVLGARERDVDEAIEEVLCSLTTQRHLVADVVADACLKGRDRLLGAAVDWLLAGNLGKSVSDERDLLFVLTHFADTNRDNHLFDMWCLHNIRPPEVTLERCERRLLLVL